DTSAAPAVAHRGGIDRAVCRIPLQNGRLGAHPGAGGRGTACRSHRAAYGRSTARRSRACSRGPSRRRCAARAGVPHGEAWSCLELAVVDAGNDQPGPALELTDTALRLFAGLGDHRGESWSRFLRCTLLPFASPGGSVVRAAVAEEELAALRRELREPGRRTGHALEEAAEAYAVVLDQGVEPEAGRRAWQLGFVPGAAPATSWPWRTARPDRTIMSGNDMSPYGSRK
ncbi:hypothetical protein K6I34_004510, partial [Streptomyces sp. UNOC14_S4]|nr:hypothetical protein [Streptomyces sp. UNOC14_S4]